MQRRVTEHNRIKGKFTDRGIPWKLVHSEIFEHKKDAMEREAFLKNKKSRTLLEDLIKKQ
jgi:putative endonuclease